MTPLPTPDSSSRTPTILSAADRPAAGENRLPPTWDESGLAHFLQATSADDGDGAAGDEIDADRKWDSANMPSTHVRPDVDSTGEN